METKTDKPGNAIIGRALCGCVVAIDFDDTTAGRAEYVRRGYMVSVVPHTEARHLIANLVYPCEHKKALDKQINS